MNRVYTIKDIAERVGVSTSTVSRVLSNAPAANVVTEATRRKIHAAVEEFGYVPNVNARRLVKNKTNLIGVAIPSSDACSHAHSVLLNRSFSETLGGVESILKQHNYRILLIFNDEKFRRQKEYLQLFKENSIDGMMIWGPRLDEPYWEELSGYHAIQANSYSSADTRMPYVGHDNFQAAYDITTTLLSKGRRRILFFGGDDRLSICRERLCGYEKALQDAGIVPDPALRVTGNCTNNNWGTSFEETLSNPNLKFDAVQCLNDGIALCCGKMLLERHYRIPEDIALTGGDRFQDEYGDLLDWKFPVISFEIKCFEIGQIVARKLLQMIENRHQDVPARELLRVQLVDTIPNKIVNDDLQVSIG